jgi:hypothetical protein
MIVRDVPRSEWGSFLESFSHEHSAWIGTIHWLVGDVPAIHIPSVALQSLSLECAVSGPILRFTFVDGISLSAVRPCVVRVQSEDRGERALEAETEDGVFIRLAFRATAFPDQLDGLAPAEPIPQRLGLASRRHGFVDGVRRC